MPTTKQAKASRLELIPRRGRNVRRSAHRTKSVISARGKLRNGMSPKATAKANEYVCAIERNQNGKYNVRIRASFGPIRRGSNGDGVTPMSSGPWNLPVYFLASSFNGAMKKLEEALQLLQKNEEKLRFWGVERTDDPAMAGDLLRDSGLWLDRRRDFPRKFADLSVSRERPVPASLLAGMRRTLADSIAPERPVDRDRERALAGD